MSAKLALLAAVCLFIRAEASQDVIKQISLNFAKPFQACKAEMGLEDAVIQEFYNFWKEGFELKNRQTGCAILCMSSKLDLLDGELELHHGKAHEFATKHGADDKMAKQLIDMLHACRQLSPPKVPDPCQTTLETARCFKAEMHKLDWAPDINLIVGEMLAEI